MPKKLTTEEFIAKARAVHGDKYDYSKVIYINANTDIIIICPIHGEFEQRPNHHVCGSECRQCGNIETGNKLKSNLEEFIQKARKIHGDKFDYSKFIYVNARTNGIIICPIHGEFEQTPDNHLSGSDCSKCSNVYSPTTEEFIQKAKLIHGDKYDYSKFIYNGANVKSTIICPIHREFEQSPGKHIQGGECRKCVNIKIGDRLRSNTEKFIAKAKLIHGDKYDYSKFIYSGTHIEGTIICPIHGEFEQTPTVHLRGCECDLCGNIKISDSKKSNREEFIRKAKLIHGDKYDYSKVEYIDVTTKVIIICPIHGEFEQTPQNHLSGCGCEICGRIKSNDYKRLDVEEFIRRARLIHGDKYDYSKFIYIDYKTKGTIICPIHGEFEQTPNDHLRYSGCSDCNKKHRKSEKWLEDLLVENNINFIKHYRDKNSWLKRQELDFYLPEYKIGIEHQGHQHFILVEIFKNKTNNTLEIQKERDIRKFNNARLNDVEILYFGYDVEKFIPEDYFAKVYTNEEEFITELKRLIEERKILLSL